MMEVILGLLSGIISGMGVGGGMILIPALILFAGVSQQTAQTANLCYFLPTAAVAIAIHLKNKNIDPKPASKLALAGIPAAILGSFLASRLSSELLGKAFAVFIIISGVREIAAGIKIKRQKE